MSLAIGLISPEAGLLTRLQAFSLTETLLDDDRQPKSLTLRQMLQSMLAGALGVQSGKNRVRDFSHGKPSHFILLGVGFTVAFVLVILGIVKLVLYLVGV